MALIGRYLQAFTVHTGYNVRDWGTSYLDTEMPTDLAGRAERDCGVYALTVAWDVYQTVKRGDPKLDVTFYLVTMLEHVTLVITDKSTGSFTSSTTTRSARRTRVTRSRWSRRSTGRSAGCPTRWARR